MIFFRSSVLALTVLLSVTPAAKANLSKQAILATTAAAAGFVALVNPSNTQNKYAQAVVNQENKVPYVTATHQKLHNTVQWFKANAFEIGAAATVVALVNHKLEGKPFNQISSLGELARLLAEKISGYSGVATHVIKTVRP